MPARRARGGSLSGAPSPEHRPGPRLRICLKRVGGWSSWPRPGWPLRDRPELGTTATAPYDRARAVVSPLRSALRAVRPEGRRSASGPPSAHRHRSARPARRPARARPRGRFPRLPHSPGVPSMVRRNGRPLAHRVFRAGRPDRAGLARPARERLAPARPDGGAPVTRPRESVPPRLCAVLASPGGKCYRHCDRPVRARLLPSRLPGVWAVRACPSGVVSVTSYTEWSRRDPTGSVRSVLRRWTVPPSRVRSRDLRLATRRGPELGRSAERLLAEERPPRPLRVVYWRVYPFAGRDGRERRLFVCTRRRHRDPVFYVADPTVPGRRCPACARTARPSPRRA
jgi:hypothetical protein